MSKLTLYDHQLLAKLKNSNTYDRIFASYVFGDRIELSETEENIRKRWETAFSLLCNYHSSETAIPMLIEQFGIKRTQAYIDIKQCMRLFGNVTKTSKEGYRYILAEYSTEIINLARKQNPPDLDAMNKAIGNLMKLRNLDKEDIDKIPFEDIIPPDFEPSGDVTLLNIKPIENLEEKRRKLREKYNVSNVEDVEIIDE